MTPQPDPLVYFRLKPIRAARVSEISETTAAAPVPSEERVNFHIGNPLQDSRLSSAFLRIALGIDVHRQDLCDTQPAALEEFLGWEPAARPKLEFLIRAVQKSSPYMPRGGYNRNAPHALVKAFFGWLENQQEPLRYDTGEKSGNREIIFASGGVIETIRIILFALADYLEVTPARILCYRFPLPTSLLGIPNLLIENLADDEGMAHQQIDQLTASHPNTPTVLLLGDLLAETTRRSLRLMSTQRPLFFIEANNAPNHLSLAREAKLVQRVVRLLTPAIFAPRLHALATVFIAGNADFLSVIENVHFKFKGTPSASEIELLTYLLEQGLADLQAEPAAQLPQSKPVFEGLGSGIAAESALPGLAERVEQQLTRALDRHAQSLAGTLVGLEEKSALFARRIQERRKDLILDEFSNTGPEELVDSLEQNAHDPAWCQALVGSFVSAFTRHHPQYSPESCLVTSGSSRTALGILGFHCGIAEVVIPDLSWSYEQCFPKVHAVPLRDDLALDPDAMIAKVEELCSFDPSWRQRGAVVVNNPHNATGRVFDEEAIRKLLVYSVQHGIYLIDDLAYQNVAPRVDLPEIKTARQIASELVWSGILSAAQAERVVTVHSMSKTDCLAGARLAVVELRDRILHQRFKDLNDHIQPNLAAILICYLFYRGSREAVRTYGNLRNAIFHERTQALLTAVENLPADRNPYSLSIKPPVGSMYPLMNVERLPAGLSLDWLASLLARRGIGLLPLATFARTEKGFETGRKSFRLTLGGMDTAEVLLAKTRRLLIDLNRLIAEEDARYNRKRLSFSPQASRISHAVERLHAWEAVTRQVRQQCASNHTFKQFQDLLPLDGKGSEQDFLGRFLPERLESFRTRLLDHALISDELLRQAQSDGRGWLAGRLEREFMKDSLQHRQELFRLRSYDRTVHPTQMYSLQAEIALNTIIRTLIARQPVTPNLVKKAANELTLEYLGQNVSITSQQEGDEILLDLDTLIAGEEYAELFSDTTLTPLLSFWSDWDGSNRPSGQGHQLAAAAVMENVQRMARLLNLLRQADPQVPVNPDLIAELERLPTQNQHFTKLLNAITSLTHQLEQRYRGVLPFSVAASPLQRLAVRLHLRQDPLRKLWQHNDRYERNMRDLRQQRRTTLEYYFALNKQLRKQLYALIPAIQANRGAEGLLREVVGYRDILQRTVITPRIHEQMITARDQFAIDTTVYNLQEINAIAGKYGNPGITLSLQISLSDRPEALISLDRKMGVQKEQTRRDNPTTELPPIWLTPLFESLASVSDIPAYLEHIWDYATLSRHAMQSPQSRYSEIMEEIFIAGSDLSQQVSQATAAFMYRKAKYQIQTWLAEHGLAELVRVKQGSGEPMQRQGGYYSQVAGLPAFPHPERSARRFAANLPAAAKQSTAYAVTPLQGVFLGGDLRTFQSALSEQLRNIPVGDFANLLYHVREMQSVHRADLIRAAETLVESRQGSHTRSVHELERLTIGSGETIYEAFLQELTANFRRILYGREEDVVGIHIISYFIARSIPQLRDRPTARRRAVAGLDRGQQILANIAETIPLARQGSLLRAIAHNQAQTVVLGVNQLTTGLFRALESFSESTTGEAERERMIAERLLPHLPVYEILHTLRIYQDWRGEFLERIETAFPAGNSAFVALREDCDAMLRYLPLFQQELLRRHGINVNDFFINGRFISELLPSLRPDLVVLLQADLFNTDLDQLLENVTGRVDGQWQTATNQLLQIPEQVRHWRSVIWEVLQDSLYRRVQSFTELATALYAFSASRSFEAYPAAGRGARLPSALADFFRSAQPDDTMRQFLISAVDYLNSFTEGSIEVPVSIIRAMNEVEHIAQIEESALPPEKLNVIRHCTLQIARLAGETG